MSQTWDQKKATWPMRVCVPAGYEAEIKLESGKVVTLPEGPFHVLPKGARLLKIAKKEGSHAA